MCVNPLHAQEADLFEQGSLPGMPVPAGDRIEKIAEASEVEQDYSILSEDLPDNFAKPLNLNNLNEEDLGRIPFLNPELRRNLLEYLKTYGDVFSVYELQAVRGFDSVIIRRILPYITVLPATHVPRLTPRNLVRYGHHDLLVRYEQAFPRAVGYLADDSVRSSGPGSYYPGSPQKYYFRYTFNWFDRIKIGLAGEKDPGEQFFRGDQPKGMDFYTAYLCLNNIGILKTLVIGNFRATFGQGLTIGSGLSAGSIPGFSSGQSANGIKPGSGMNEGSYLKGLAATVKIKSVGISAFTSYHPRDATITRTDSISDQANEVSSLAGTGYHRTSSELEKRNALTELVCGANVNFSLAPNQQLGFRIGMTGIYYRYSADISSKLYPYNRFSFRGTQNLNTGMDLQLRYHGMYLFAEISRSLNHGLAWLAGMILSPDPAASVTLICRNYQPEFQNLFSNAFGQNAANANEQGIYAGLNAAIRHNVTLSGFVDIFSFPWLKYRTDTPVPGHEIGLMLLWKPSSTVSFNLRFSQKNTRINEEAAPDQIIHRLCDNITRSLRFGIWLLAGNGIEMNTRVELKENGAPGIRHPFGCLVYEEARLKLRKYPETLTLRFALFDVPEYPARIYVYEPEVLYGYSVPSYQGKGLRTCVVMKFGITRRLDLWLRGGITCYTDRQSVGSGLDMTQGNIRGELTCQCLVRL